MAIVNRDLDSTQQRAEYQSSLANTVTGATYHVALVPYPARLISCYATGVGLSGAPHISLWAHRFIAGTGFTSIVMGSTVVLPAFGTSGGVTLSVQAAGNTYLLQAGDALVLYAQNANTGATEIQVATVVQALQDIKSEFGVGQ